MDLNDLHDLLSEKTENDRIDYKLTLNWNMASKGAKGEIVKDILAFSNAAGGGRIIFGVRDEDYEPIGMPEEDFHSFDPTNVNAFLHQYTDPKHSVGIYKCNDAGKLFVVLDVPEFMGEPIICKKDLQLADGKNLLQRGALYLRKKTAESTIIDSSESMRDLLSRALKNRSDELLRSIQILLSGRKPMIDSEEIFKDKISYAQSLVNERIGSHIDENDLGSMTLMIYPDQDISEIIGDIFTLRDRFHRAQVSHRGWTFPHEQNNKAHGDTYNVDEGIFSYTKFERHIEAFCLFNCGLFYWKSALWEDAAIISTSEQNVFSFISFIYHTMEFILFINKFYDFENIIPNITICFSMCGCAGRKIVSMNSMVTIWENYICGVDQINNIRIQSNLSELIADPKTVSSELIKKVFQYFNFKLNENDISEWQDKFLNRTF